MVNDKNSDYQADRFVIGLGMIPRGEVGLIFVGIGADLVLDGKPVIDPATYGAGSNYGYCNYDDYTTNDRLALCQKIRLRWWQRPSTGPGEQAQCQHCGTFVNEHLMAKTPKQKLRSQEWFDNPADPGMTALYLERYLNYGLTRDELQSGKPLIGIAQTGGDLTPCNYVACGLSRKGQGWHSPSRGHSL